jgi:acyl-CoA thioester hydrolase
MDTSKLPVTYAQTIPSEYEDEMGHMNVTWYGYLFDKATYGLFELWKFGLVYHTQSGNGSFALEQHIRYYNEVHIGENVTLRSRLLGRRQKTYHFMHFMIRDRDGELAATSEMVGVHVDLNTRRSSPLPPEISDVFDAILNEHNKLDWDAPVCGAMKA